MKVFSCEHEWEAMLSCIYEAWTSGLGQENIRLELEPLGQQELFTEYEHVDADCEKFQKVADAIKVKISQYVYSELAYTAMACEADVLDNIYRVLILGFHYGKSVLDMIQYHAVMRNREIRVRLGNEACRFKEIVRFHDVGNNLLVAHVEPKSRIIASLAVDFSDRMPSENWIIVDDIHNEAVVHPMNQPFYIRKLSDTQKEQLLVSEELNDQYTDLWQVFFESIAIKERNNRKLQMNHMPLWSRTHVVEFQKSSSQ